MTSKNAISIWFKNSTKFLPKNDDTGFCRLTTFAFLYMDYLVVIGSFEKHIQKNLTDVFKLCRQHNLKLHPEKCTFFMKEVTYLGHKCTDRGIHPEDSKYDVIKNYPKPANADEARRFVAFFIY